MIPELDGPLLCLAGTLPSAKVLKQLVREHTQLIATDYAAELLLDNGIAADVVIGDMDSIQSHVLDKLKAKGKTVVVDTDDERGDFEKALQYLVERDEARVTIIGIDGGTLDHTLNNFSIAARYVDFIEMSFMNIHSEGIVVNDRCDMHDMSMARVSLIPLPMAVVTTTGLKWNLNIEELAFGAREGASNEAVDNHVTIEVHRGAVIVFTETVYEIP